MGDLKNKGLFFEYEVIKYVRGDQIEESRKGFDRIWSSHTNVIFNGWFPIT